VELDRKELKRVSLVTLGGRIDSHSAARLEEELSAITKAKRFRIVVDLQEVEYMSSRSLRALIATLKETRRWDRGDLCLCNIPPNIREVLDLTGLTPLFNIYEDATEAVGSF
jgi:anti-anti-sigma factor